MSSSSSSYQQLAHLQIPLKEIVSATDNFSDANLIREDGFGNQYKGQLYRNGQWINIVARKLDVGHELGKKLLWTEVSMLSRLEHQNIVSILGFCEEDGENIVVNKHESKRGNLYDHLSDPAFTWLQRLQICVGLADALSYIYYDKGRDFSVIVGDITSAKILLDDRWEPKLSCFEISISQPAAERGRPCQVPDDDIWGTDGYMDPAYLATGSVSHKSDMFSLGVVLMEVLCGKGTTEKVNADDMYLYDSAISQYRKGRLYDLVNPGLRKQIGPESFKIFSKTAYSCLKAEPSKRPSIDQIVIQLKKALKSQRDHDTCQLILNDYSMVEGTTSKSFKITLEDLVSATNNFSDENLIRRGGFGKIYKGQLLRSGQLIDIVARRLDTTSMQGKKEFLMEVSLLSTLKHENIVSMVGFCDQGNEKIIINKRESHGSLDEYLSDPTTLTWIRRLEICLGVARALSYIHYDKHDFSVIHRNIKSSKVLLDDNWEPKLCGFEVSVKVAKARRHRLHLDRVSGTVGYIDPIYEKTGGVTHKSDVYSFGVVLFEVLCGRRAYNTPEWFSFSNPLAKLDLEPDIIMGKADEVVKQGFVEGTLDVVEKVDEVVKQGSEEGMLDLEEKANAVVERSLQSAEQQGPAEGSADVVEKKYDEVIDHDDNQGIVEGTRGKQRMRWWKKPKRWCKKPMRWLTRIIILQKRPSSSSSRNLSAGRNPYGYGPPSCIENLPVQLRSASSSSLAGRNPSIIYPPIYSADTPEFVGMNKEKDESEVYTQQEHPALNPQDIENFSVPSRSASCGSLAGRNPSNNSLDALEFVEMNLVGNNFNKYYPNAYYKEKEEEYSDQIYTQQQSPALNPPDIENFSVSSHSTSCSSLVSRNPSNNSLDPVEFVGTGLVGKNFRKYYPNAYYKEKEEESDQIYMQQQRPAQNPRDMCMFTLAPSARFHFEESIGHLRIPEEDFLAPLAISHYEEKKLNDLIHPDLWKQMDTHSFNLFSKTAYDCLKEQRSERPHIDQIVITLQEALNLQQRHEHPSIFKEHVEVTTEVESTSTKWKNLEHLKISFQDIKLATQEFSETHCIGSGTYGKVYKAELEHFDSQNSSKIEGKNICDLPKIRNTVAIKCISKREDKQDKKGFFAEIETLTTCKHRNVVSLLGFCDEESQMILIYEYVSRGSLDSCLRNIEKMTNLKWVHRLQMCLDIAEGIKYLHTKHNIIHRDIKSDNILLDDNWVAKIADFGLSKIGSMSQQVSFFKTNVAGTQMYLDPEYNKTLILRKASDIYSLGVVLFEIVSGRLAYDAAYTKKNANGLAPFARQQYENRTLKDMLDPKIKEEFDENVFTLTKGPNKDSMDTFLDIAYRCLAETQAQRPDIETVVDQLKKALLFQKNHKDMLQISLEDIKLATDNFSDKNRIGRGGFGRVYKGEVTNANGRHTTIAAKRLDTTGGQGEIEFLTELEILLEYKNENVIGLVGYCNEPGEKIIVYEYASRGSLDWHLSNNDLTWRKRLGICIDIARGLNFLHAGGVTQEVVMHRDIKSPNILLGDDWKAKISDFGLSSITSINDYVIDNACGTKGYCDPLYLKHRVFTKESDIYSFGVLLFEILCGRLMFEKSNDSIKILIDTFKSYYRKRKLDDMVFKGIRGQIAPKSLTTFQILANVCVHDLREKRPTIGGVLKRLEKALEFQEDYEIWEPKLPKDYEKIFKMSNFSDLYSTTKKKDLHDMLSRGVLLQKGKVLFSLGDNGERNEMISARKVFYKHRRLNKWPSVPESRFHEVAEMLEISNLKIKIKIKAQFLSVGVNYGVYLVFRFCAPRESVGKRMYVNLKYKKGSETLRAYFATWREDGWMMIELCQFLKNKEHTHFEFLLDSFSRCYCGSRALHVEGIEFRAIDNVKHEDLSKNLEEVQVLKTNLNMDQVEELGYSGNHEEFLTQYKVNKEESCMISAKEALHESQSRSEDVIELQRQQVFRIKCKIESQRLSPNTEYACYIVFKLSEKCHGLHCPVIVRDLLKRKNKEKGIVYFRSPSSCNVNHADRIPQEREDGWMEVNVWQFNSSNELRNNHVSINLKLICYEGTMFGLIISGLEFRPM